MTPWLVGNTTLRNPFRLQESLAVFRDSKFNGSLVTVQEQTEFLELLSDKGVVKTAFGEHTSFNARKWRSVLYQLGFITQATASKVDENKRHKLLLDIAADVKGISGLAYELTPNGSRLADALVPAEEYDCFLRALAAYQLPSISEPDFQSTQRFAPLFIVLQILKRLGDAGHDAKVSFEEMASVVMFSQDHATVSLSVDEIISYRERKHAVPSKRAFDIEYRVEQMANHKVTVQADTLKDYADTNFRYLKATGLFVASGRGIKLAPEKVALAEQLLTGFTLETNDAKYLKRLYNGSSLPSDSPHEAVAVLESIAQLLRDAGRVVNLPNLLGKNAEEINQIRFRLESQFSNVREEAYAADQKTKWPEILEELRKLGNRNRYRGAEAPAYLEWAIWRAFLAINSLVNKPWEARRFKVDQDFFPISTAPGNGPDALFEFSDFVIVAEVTFTTNSRQEAAEGEPVRRHVANEVVNREGTDKEVYGLFIANKIDSNTAETFRHGTWFKLDDSKLALSITPLTIEQFCRVFEAHFNSGQMLPGDVRQVIRDCLVHSNQEGPLWKQKIAQEIDARVASTTALAAATKGETINNVTHV